MTIAFIWLGKKGSSSLTRATTASDTFSALAPLASTMPMPAEALPARRDWIVRLSAPSSTRATSFSSTSEPSAAARSTTFSNCSGVLSLLRAVTVALSSCCEVAGSPPSWPAETCAFCALSAAPTSDGISANFSSLRGSSQTRIA